MQSKPPIEVSFQDKVRHEIRSLIRNSAVVLLVVFGFVGIWSIFASVSGAVIAAGVIKVEENAKHVQHQTGGIVKRILVKEGQGIRVGEPLFELEDVESLASFEIVSDQIAAETAKLARLQAENMDAPRINFPPNLASRQGERKMKAILNQENQHFLARQQLYNEQISGMRIQQRELHTEIASLARQIEAAKESLSYLQDQEKMFVALKDQEFISQARLLDAQRAIADKREKLHEYESLHAQAHQKLADLDLRISNLRENRLTENSREIVEVQNRLLDLRERRKPYQDAMERTIIRSPANGIINAIHIHTEGGVIGPREPIMEITPAETRLVAEVRLNPADVDEISIEQAVEVEFSGLNRRVTPLIAGKVEFVSADLLTDPNNPTLKYFTVRVLLTPREKLNFELKAGMPVVAYIQTRERTPIEIWLDPLLGGLRKALRES